MTAARTEKTSNALLAVMIVLFLLAETGLAAMGATAWLSYHDDDFAAAQAGPFMVMGVSAAIGAILATLAVIALFRDGRGLARNTLNLTWLRLGAVLIALVVVPLITGVSAAGVFGMVLALGDALAGFVVTGAAVRRTRDG